MAKYAREYAKAHPTEKDKYWCVHCETWVTRSEMNINNSDDDVTMALDCPGCDLTLLVIEYGPEDEDD